MVIFFTNIIMSNDNMLQVRLGVALAWCRVMTTHFYLAVPTTQSVD